MPFASYWLLEEPVLRRRDTVFSKLLVVNRCRLCSYLGTYSTIFKIATFNVNVDCTLSQRDKFKPVGDIFPFPFR